MSRDKNGRSFFTEKARLAGVAARKRNAVLRKKGLLPPTKQHRKAETIPLDHPIFAAAPQAKQKKKQAPTNATVIVRLLDIVRELLLQGVR